MFKKLIFNEIHSWLNTIHFSTILFFLSHLHTPAYNKIILQQKQTNLITILQMYWLEICLISFTWHFFVTHLIGTEKGPVWARKSMWPTKSSFSCNKETQQTLDVKIYFYKKSIILLTTHRRLLTHHGFKCHYKVTSQPSWHNTRRIKTVKNKKISYEGVEKYHLFKMCIIMWRFTYNTSIKSLRMWDIPTYLQKFWVYEIFVKRIFFL